MVCHNQSDYKIGVIYFFRGPKEKTSPVAYYNAPSMDGNRPGVFYANMAKVATTYKWGMKTLAYHEAIPGHHFQISIARELKGLPTFRTVLPFTAYVEG